MHRRTLRTLPMSHPKCTKDSENRAGLRIDSDPLNLLGPREGSTSRDSITQTLAIRTRPSTA
eukprot:7767916-Pyramimonas_sp.AAC.1